MSQQEVLNFLRRNWPRWFTAEEIYEAINVNGTPSLGSVTRNLARLKRGFDIFSRIKHDNVYHPLEYRYKRPKENYESDDTYKDKIVRGWT